MKKFLLKITVISTLQGALNKPYVKYEKAYKKYIKIHEQTQYLAEDKLASAKKSIDKILLHDKKHRKKLAQVEQEVEQNKKPTKQFLKTASAEIEQIENEVDANIKLLKSTQNLVTDIEKILDSSGLDKSRQELIRLTNYLSKQRALLNLINISNISIWCFLLSLYFPNFGAEIDKSFYIGCMQIFPLLLIGIYLTNSRITKNENEQVWYSLKDKIDGLVAILYGELACLVAVAWTYTGTYIFLVCSGMLSYAFWILSRIIIFGAD
jgi:hypothetical protein